MIKTISDKLYKINLKVKKLLIQVLINQLRHFLFSYSKVNLEKKQFTEEQDLEV